MPILGNPGVTHYVTLHSSPLRQLTDETSFSMNIHNTSIANQNVANIALLSSAEDSFVLLPLLKITQKTPINVFVSN